MAVVASQTFDAISYAINKLQFPPLIGITATEFLNLSVESTGFQQDLSLHLSVAAQFHFVGSILLNAADSVFISYAIASDSNLPKVSDRSAMYAILDENDEFKKDILI